jgi:hypothetical protein
MCAADLESVRWLNKCLKLWSTPERCGRLVTRSTEGCRLTAAPWLWLSRACLRSPHCVRRTASQAAKAAVSPLRVAPVTDKSAIWWLA